MKVQPWAATTAAFAAGTLAAVGIAQATSAPTKIPDSNTGVITACMVKKTGAVRFINAQNGKVCKSGEKKITFSQTGPQGTRGDTGATGASGPAGTPGERGPSNGYAVVGASRTVREFPWQANVLATLRLPAGNYILVANTAGAASNDVTYSIGCFLQSTAGTLTSAGAHVSSGQLAALVETADHTFAVAGSLATDGPATVTLNCTPRDNDNGFVYVGEAAMDSSILTATRVGDLQVTGAAGEGGG
jgi:hypothetical protein